MEEQSKYYTPSIEEFCVGLEYEAIPKEGKPVKCVFPKYPRAGIDWGTNNVYEILERGLNTRVKYLDEEDIEELGWKKCENYDREYGSLITYSIYNNDEEYIAILSVYQDKKIRIAGGTNHPRFLFFYGIIKNKSELKRLMKQLGIEI